MCHLVGSRGGRGRGGENVSSPVDPAIPRRFVPDFRTRRIRSAGGNESDGAAPDGKKRARALLPAHERTKETIVEYEVEYKLSSGDRARNQSTSCPESALPFRSFPAYRLLYSKLYQTRHATLGWGHCAVAWKKLGRIYIRSDECFLLVRNLGKLNLSMRSENNKGRRQPTGFKTLSWRFDIRHSSWKNIADGKFQPQNFYIIIHVKNIGSFIVVSHVFNFIRTYVPYRIIE